MVGVPSECGEPDLIAEGDPVVQLHREITCNDELIPVLEIDAVFTGTEDLIPREIMFEMDPGGRGEGENHLPYDGIGFPFEDPVTRRIIVLQVIDDVPRILAAGRQGKHRSDHDSGKPFRFPHKLVFDPGFHISQSPSMRPERDQGIAPGQFAVLYDGQVCLGGGVIQSQG